MPVVEQHVVYTGIGKATDYVPQQLHVAHTTQLPEQRGAILALQQRPLIVIYVQCATVGRYTEITPRNLMAVYGRIGMTEIGNHLRTPYRHQRAIFHAHIHHLNALPLTGDEVIGIPCNPLE